MKPQFLWIGDSDAGLHHFEHDFLGGDINAKRRVIFNKPLLWVYCVDIAGQYQIFFGLKRVWPTYGLKAINKIRVLIQTDGSLAELSKTLDD